MKAFPSAYLSHILQDCTTLAWSWRVIRTDGMEILGTEHNLDIEITTGGFAGVYLSVAGITGSDIRSTGDLSVDNLETSGMVGNDLILTDLNPADIEAGLFDDADVTVFMLNYEAPDVYQDVIRVGFLGNVTRTSEGAWKSECRGLTQAFSQGIVRTHGVGCDAELGDARCKVDLGPHTWTGEIASVVVQRREFTVSYDTSGVPAADRLIAGKITMTSGLNAQFAKEIRQDTPTLRVFDKFPRDVAVGDTFEVQAGCRKRLLEDCRDIYNNVLNFRGHGVFVPGDNELLKVGKR